MESKLVRKTFLDFFREKQHEIVSSAPMVIKDDPTLMFTNAGMNQFKDIFLGNRNAISPRVADTQKCLRVSGKHNDLEEVGHDTYHHTMFEMLGNWSFGDYFKKEAIAWGWELLTDVFGIDPERLYATVFEGDAGDGLEPDEEAFSYWGKILPKERILYGSKKDNFWEMGETGPCGPCSEIHIDLRDQKEREKIDGRELVNKDHPEVIEIWNLVFIEFNRKKDGSLEPLPARHVDTGMGFERLCMALQEKKSNYDTDVFAPLIHELGKLTGLAYGKDADTDVAMRVVADHLRAIAFAITDGQLPSNTGAGYVIRRILRRAVRYAYTFLDQKEPVIYKLCNTLTGIMGDAFPELKKQQELIGKVIREEEHSFLHTLEQGIRRFDQYIKTKHDSKLIEGDFAFELFDTYGFPVDLTELIAREKGWTVDMEGFKKGLEVQKQRSRKAAELDKDEWILLAKRDVQTQFVGYDTLEAEVKVLRYREVQDKKKKYYEIVLDKTPFYAESGGQAGDMGTLRNDDEIIRIFNTVKENDMIVHFADRAPGNGEGKYKAEVDYTTRLKTVNNHSATHLMHFALRKVLGNHVEQKGSLVDADHLRFDFSHFEKMTDEDIFEVEKTVNAMIRENNPIDEHREVGMQKALDMGALAFFGEKYGDKVRVIRFGESIELCGGTHVAATGQIGYFKIISESAIAAGVRRIEAITGEAAEEYLQKKLSSEAEIRDLLKNPKDVVKGVHNLMEENRKLQKQAEALNRKLSESLLSELLSETVAHKGIDLLTTKVDAGTDVVKNLAFSLIKKNPRLVAVIGNAADGKAFLTVGIGEEALKQTGLNAGNLVRELAKNIKGGGGGQAHFATAGGKDPSGIQSALDSVKALV
ncbi:MAG: alanine--tRNA ligase [Bacteroidales bacterium]|jgi:alanyl-tRNA synthetase|nr:alanine--tRNA ligase [Bacteroidales bacterium]